MESEALQYSTDGFYVWMEDSASAGSGKTGLTLTIKLSKVGSVQQTVTPLVAEIGDGLYFVVPFGQHRSDVGRNAWTFAGSGAFLTTRVENVLGGDVPRVLIPTTVCLHVDGGVGTPQAQLAVGYVTSAADSYRTAMRFDFSQLNSADISSAILRITKDGIIDAGETGQQFQVRGVKVDDTLPTTQAEFTSDISGLDTVDALHATVSAVADGNELSIDLTAMFAALASDSSYLLIYLTEYFGGGIEFSSPMLEVSTSTAASSMDVNVISVGGTSVGGPEDFKADVSGLATAANLAAVAGYLDTEIASILADTNELQTNQGNWITATGFAVAGDAMTLTAGAITAIDTELTSEHGSGSWTTGGGGGGDATAANQATIIDHLTAMKGATFNEATDSLEALRDRGDAAWITATGFAVAGDAMTLTVGAITAIDTELTSEHGSGSWTTGGGGGGDATAASQTVIIAALDAIKGATFDGDTDSLEAIRNRGDSVWSAQQIIPSATTFQANSGLRLSDTIRIIQRDDYSAADGRAFEWLITNPSIDFTDVSVEMGAAAGTNGSDTLTATASLQDKAVGSCKLRVEFTSLQSDVSASQYSFDGHFLRDSRRITPLQLSVTVEEKYAD